MAGNVVNLKDFDHRTQDIRPRLRCPWPFATGLDEAAARLREIYASQPVEDVCVWRLDNLHGRLAAKHRETFWVKAKSLQRDSAEWFQLESVTHTTRPSVEQFDRLLGDGTVTLDHLIKRKPSGSVTEKGPLFKIDRPRIAELFLGKPRGYSLLA